MLDLFFKTTAIDHSAIPSRLRKAYNTWLC